MTTKSRSGTGRLFFKLALLSSAAMMVSACSYDIMGPDGGGVAGWESQARANERPAEDAYAAGKKQYKKGLYGLALKNFHTALSHKPKSVESLNAVAATYDKLGRFDLSRRYYARALALDPESPQTLNNIGYSFVMQKDFTSARAYFERARKAGGSANTRNAVGANLSALDSAEGRDRVPSQLAGVPVHASTVTPVNASATTPKTPHRNAPVVKNGDRIQVIATVADSRKVAVEDVPKVAAVAVTPVKIRNRRVTQQPVLALAAAPQPAPVTREEIEPVALSKPVTPPKTLVKEPVPADRPVVLAKLAEPVAQSEPVAKMSTPATRSKPVASMSEPVIEISNGAGRRFLAARTRDYLTTKGVNTARLTNADNYSYRKTAVFYREGYRERAHAITHMFPMPVAMYRVDKQRSDIRVRLGADSLEFDARMLALRSAGS
jgi:tetratricopeptide (TPR) repeat protein